MSERESQQQPHVPPDLGHQRPQVVEKLLVAGDHATGEEKQNLKGKSNLQIA